MSDWNPNKICRDEDCEITEVHGVHRRLLRKPVLVHHRPRKNAPLASSLDDGRLPTHKELLAERVFNAIGDRPMMMQWISCAVRDDYGSVTDRTIYRYVQRFVQEAKIIKLDLGLAFAIYIRPKSRLLQDRVALHEYMMSNADCLPACTKESVA
jgi:hypothetical protein